MVVDDREFAREVPALKNHNSLEYPMGIYWTKELKRLMFQRVKLKKLASRFPTDGNWTSYKHMKNKVNYEIKNAKMNYYNAFFKDNRRNIKNT